MVGMTAEEEEDEENRIENKKRRNDSERSNREIKKKVQREKVGHGVSRRADCQLLTDDSA